LLDCADNFLVVKTLAVKSGLRPAKLPDIRTFFATVSLHTFALNLFLLRRRCGLEESSDIKPKGRGLRNQSSELLCGGNALIGRCAHRNPFSFATTRLNRTKSDASIGFSGRPGGVKHSHFGWNISRFLQF
jgi:hypothetical protein